MTDDLRSETILLRRLTLDDAVHFERLLGHDSASVQMMATMPDPCTEEAARGWIEMRTNGGGHLFAITRTSDGEFLGGIGFGGAPEAFVLGYWLGRPYWGCGYVTEAVQMIVGYARSLGGEKLHAETWPTNPASARVLEKAGFRNLGTSVVDIPQRGGLRESCQYELVLR